jgi:hypothetical protein
MADAINLQLGRHAIELAEEEWGNHERVALTAQKSMVSISALAELAREHDGLVVNCLDPWLIAYSQPRAQRVAKRALEHQGFECWYPLRKVVTTRPLRTLSSKTRHRRRRELVEKIEPVFGPYLFIRPLRADSDCGRIREFNGCGGMCHFGGRVAVLNDYEIELIRLAEANGKFNIYHETVRGPYRVSLDIDPRSQWDGKTRLIGRLDTASESVEFIDVLDRVIRKIHTARIPVAQ